MERPILRSELRSASSTPPPPSDDEAVQRLRNLSSLQYATQDTPMINVPPATQAEEDEEELAFNLFTPTISAANAKTSDPKPTVEAQKIRIRSPSLDVAGADFIRPARDLSYYFADTLDSQTKANFQAAALSGSQIATLSKLPWPGSAYPWKVLHIPSSSIPRPQRIKLTQHASAGFAKLGQLEEPAKRRRLGKKGRIAARQKLKAEEAKREQASKSKEIQEAEEREKRTRRNREKKVKRKAKEKAKKAEGGGAGAGDEAADDASSGED